MLLMVIKPFVLISLITKIEEGAFLVLIRWATAYLDREESMSRYFVFREYSGLNRNERDS